MSSTSRHKEYKQEDIHTHRYYQPTKIIIIIQENNIYKITFVKILKSQTRFV